MRTEFNFNSLGCSLTASSVLISTPRRLPGHQLPFFPRTERTLACKVRRHTPASLRGGHPHLDIHIQNSHPPPLGKKFKIPYNAPSQPCLPSRWSWSSTPPYPHPSTYISTYISTSISKSLQFPWREKHSKILSNARSHPCAQVVIL